MHRCRNVSGMLAANVHTELRLLFGLIKEVLSTASHRDQPAVSPGRPHQLQLHSHSAPGAEAGSGPAVRPHPALHATLRRAQGPLPLLLLCSSSLLFTAHPPLHVLHLLFWLLQMTNPAIQNDFSYYRRTISRMRINNLSVSKQLQNASENLKYVTMIERE